MGYTIPIEVYEKFEEKLGKETASIVVKVLEMSIKEAIREGKEDLKSKITEELKKELATKYDIELLKKDIDILRQETNEEIVILREEMHREIGIVKKEIDFVRKDIKIITIIILAAMILLSQNSLEFLAKLFGLLK